MKKHRFISAVTAAALPLSLTSCTLRDLSGKKEEPVYNEETTTKEKKPSGDISGNGNMLFSGEAAPELDEIREHVKQLLDDIKVSDNADKIQEDIDAILYDIDACHEAYSVITLDYYSDWTNEALNESYDYAYEKYYIANQLAIYAFSHGYAVDEYSEIFEPYINEEAMEYYTNPFLSLKRLEGYAKVDYEVMDERLEEYYDIISDEDLDNDEINLKCAELYLDLLAGYDIETFYENYNRDYSPEVILDLSQTVRKKLIPVSDRLWNDLDFDEEDDSLIFDDPFGVIREYAPKLSDDILGAANKINDENLYIITRDDESYDGSFTTSLPVSKSALVYIHDYGDYHSLMTPVHEFGHFYASMYDDIPSYSCVGNMDIAEIQSQGFELIFSRFYDDIYGENSELMRAVVTSNILDAVITGFFIGEFEYTVLKNRDTFTPEDVVNCFHEIMDDYSPYWEFYYISHLFEQPGYYISYGVSALAAFDIWADSLYDPDEALEKYEKIARISCDSDKYQFCSALKECGFNDVLNKEYINVLAEELSDYTDEFENNYL